MTGENTVKFEDLPPEEQQAISERESEEALARGFAKVNGTEPEKADKEEKPKDELDGKPSATEDDHAKDGDTKKEEDEFTEDPWGGVPDVVKTSIQRLEQATSSIPTQIRKLQGQFGTLNRDIKIAQQTATEQTKEAGSKAPTQAEIDEATKTEAAWKALEEDYPDWASALGGQMKLLEKRLETKIPNVNLDEFGNRILDTVDQRMRQNNQMQREYGKIDFKHPDWENTINSEEYRDWLFQGGPTVDEFFSFKTLEDSDPAKANEVLNDIIRRHPTWWSDKGSKLFSDHAKEAIELLDAYTASKAGEEPGSGNPPPADTSANSRSARNSERLKRAAVPQGNNAPPSTGISDDEAFIRGHKRVAAMRKF